MLDMNLPAWRAAIRKGTKHFERSRLQSLDDKRSARKNRGPNPSTAVPCQLCGKICASTFGLQAHMCKHQHWRVIFEIEGLLLLDMNHHISGMIQCLQWYDFVSLQLCPILIVTKEFQWAIHYYLNKKVQKICLKHTQWNFYCTQYFNTNSTHFMTCTWPIV